MNNSENRSINVFFYGLYMDPDLLKAKGVEPRSPRKAVAKGYRLRVGKMATLVREPDAEAHGIMYQLTHDEVDKLYWGAGLNMYVAEALMIEVEGGEYAAALCCNLLVPPSKEETNSEYVSKLMRCMDKLGVARPDS